MSGDISRAIPFFSVPVRRSIAFGECLLMRIGVKATFVSRDGKLKKFDFNLRKCVSQNVGYSKKQRRAFQRLMSGLTVGKSRNQRLRFMTLTTSDQAKDLGFNKKLNDHFRALKMRIYRKYNFKMKYWKIRTNEGNGVLHIVFRGKYVPQKWLSSQWADIHKSPIVDHSELV